MHQKYSPAYYWIKTLRKYRRLQKRTAQQPDSKSIIRKLDILTRRIWRMHRRWRLAVPAALLALWLSTEAQAQQAFPSALELYGLDGSNGFALNGIYEGDRSGVSVSAAGDINGDGLDDIIIGAWLAGPNGNSSAGESYVVFGKREGFPFSLELSGLDGTNGFVINGIDRSDVSGGPVSAAGDVNGDGLDDIIIGASRAGPNGNSDAGESYVVFGKRGGFPSSLELSGLDGTNGFVINGIDRYDLSGGSVSAAGDVNGDGLDDIIIGANLADPNGNSYAGESYVVFGKREGFPSSLELSGLDGSNGFVINGSDAFDRSGRSVSAAGDVNGDGLDDIIIGAWLAGPNGNSSAGESYVVFGKREGFPSSLELSGLDGSNGFVINGIDEGDRSGKSVSAAGDVNGDGLDDIIIGANFAAPNGITLAGESYVVFGKREDFPSSLELSDLDGSNGFVINGIDEGDRLGWSVSTAGDVNGDGLDDIIIGANFADPNGNSDAGESYVVFGKREGFPSSLELSGLDGTNGFVINGIDERDYSGSSVSAAGDVNGDGLDDIIIGASFADPNGKDNAGESYVVFGKLTPTQASNNTPEIVASLESFLDSLTLESGFETITISLNDVFSDPDGDTLSYTLSSSNEELVTASIASGELLLSLGNQASGDVTITVTANDGQGGEVSDSITLTITESPSVPLSITDSTTPTLKIGKPYPNPIQGTMNFSLTLDKPDILRLEIYDSQGRAVETISGIALSAGEHILRVSGNWPKKGLLYYCISGKQGTLASGKILSE